MRHPRNVPREGWWPRTVREVRHNPAALAGVVATGVAAVLAGGLLAVLLSGREPQVAAEPSPPDAAASTEATTGAVETPRATIAATPMPTPTPTATMTPGPSPTAQPTPSPVPATATPRPSRAPTPSPDVDEDTVTGRWEKLPDLPDPELHIIADAITLPDGRIAVFRSDAPIDGGLRVDTFDPATEGWEAVELIGIEPPVHNRYMLAADGRIYAYGPGTSSVVLDPTGTRWSVNETQVFDAVAALVDPDVVQVELAGAATPDGRFYFAERQDEGGGEPQTTRLIEVELATGAATTTSSTHAGWEFPFAHDSLIYAVGAMGIIAYDPSTDTWSTPTHYPREFMVEQNAGFGPDDRLYASTGRTELFAFDPHLTEWRPVALPGDVPASWHARFVAGADDRLYAINFQGTYAFTPHS